MSHQTIELDANKDKSIFYATSSVQLLIKLAKFNGSFQTHCFQVEKDDRVSLWYRVSKGNEINAHFIEMHIQCSNRDTKTCFFTDSFYKPVVYYKTEN